MTSATSALAGSPLPDRVEDIYRTLAAGLPGGIAVIVDHELRYLLADGEGLAVAGLSSSDLEGRTLAEALPPEFSEQYETPFRQALAGTPFVIENNSYGHHYLTQGTPLLGEDGKVYAVLAVSYDVTGSAERAFAARERAAAEEALHRSEERMRLLITTVSDFVFRMNADWSETHSLTTSELLDADLDPYLPWIDTYIPEEDRGEVRRAISTAIASKGVFELEHRVLQPDGSIGWAYSRAVPVLDDEGEIVEWFGASSVITDRKLAEMALQASEERFRQLFTTMEEGLLLGEVVRTSDGQVDFHIADVNPAYEQIAGFSRERVADKSLRAALPDLEEYWYEPLERAGINGETVRLEKFAGPFGRWLDVRYAPAGQPGDGRVAIMASDVTERVEAREALRKLNETLERQVEERTEELRRSQVRFEQAFAVGPMAAAITTIEDDRFLNVNQSFCRLTGYSEEEVLGRSATKLGFWCDERDQQRLSEALSDSPDLFRELELGLRTKDGEHRDILASGAIINLDDGQGWLRLFVDITARKRSEDEVMKAIEAVLSDTTWFGRKVIERLTNLRSGGPAVTAVDELTNREIQVLERLARGMTNDQISADLDIAPKTVRNHVGNIYSKLGVNSRAQAVVWARERGFVG